MRIVAVADTHLFEDELEVPAGDVFVHAGDMLRGGDLEELARAARWIRSLPHKHKIVVAGNHDWCFVRDRPRALQMLGDDVVYLQDSAHVIDGVRFWGSPWQPEFHSWAFNLPRGEALAAKWALIPDDTHVLITHGPPHGFGDRTSMPGRPTGCVDLLAASRRVRPMLHMYGHIHEDGGAWLDEEPGQQPARPIVFANVTTWECERAASVFEVLGPTNNEEARGTVKLVTVPARSSR